MNENTAAALMIIAMCVVVGWAASSAISGRAEETKAAISAGLVQKVVDGKVLWTKP
jgi:hypothetical protein